MAIFKNGKKVPPLSAQDLRELAQTLQEAVVESGNPTGMPEDKRGFWCDALNDVPDGAEPVGDEEYSVRQWVNRRNRGRQEKDKTIHRGYHGRKYLAVSPVTRRVSCSACNGG